MTSCNHMCFHLCSGSREPFVNKTMLGLTRQGWSQDCLRTVTTLPWTAQSPDFSALEYIWDHLGWRGGHPTNLNELEARLQQILHEMSEDITHNFFASMPDRIASCIRARGGSRGCPDCIQQYWLETIYRAKAHASSEDYFFEKLSYWAFGSFWLLFEVQHGCVCGGEGRDGSSSFAAQGKNGKCHPSLQSKRL
ncbi:transposable element Tcb1 transposase [Trichonephila clavipes]|nr:transposable element Tcb1 transposase [Trichonephila clavipes]